MRKNTLLGLFLLMEAYGCAPKMFMGMMPRSARCVAILPFEIEASATNQMEFLSEFIALDLSRHGLSNLLGPREVGALFEENQMNLPIHLTTEMVSTIGNAMGATHVVFGYVSDIPLVRSANLSMEESQVGVDAFLVDIKAMEIKWTYSTKKIVEAKSDTRHWSEISEDIVAHMQLERDSEYTKQSSCWKKPDRIVAFSKGSKKKEDLAKIPQAIESMLTMLRSKGMELKSEAFIQRTDQLDKLAVEQLHDLSQAARYSKDDEVLVLDSHVDAGMDEKGDLKLAELRGESVKKYLMNLGVKQGKIRVVSHGSSQPKVPNITKKSRELNRRIHVQLQSVAHDTH